MSKTLAHRSRAVLFAASSIAALAIPSLVNAQAAAPVESEESPGIVVRSDILPDTNPPGGALDNVVNVTGVGQMRTRPNQASTAGGVCTGTAINPRTVIFAAHCVNSVPQGNYGFGSGGTALSFGFEADNIPAVRLWLGLASAPGGTDANPALFQNKTNVARHLYNVEQVWYDPRSLQPPGFTFVQADVALATLDTHADNIPTWTLLFSPLTEPTHALLNGYGARGANGLTGANLGVDSRRRIAENMIDFLGSLDDRNNLLFSTILGGAPGAPLLSATVYQTDFDDPAGVTVTANPGGGFNFDIFPGQALAREGTTAGGDSGGPLIIDQKYTTKTIAGVLSGGSRFFGAQPFSSYGSTSFYQPLFLYWDVIVANNPYVYASAKAGSGNWFDPSRWVQDLDPNYKIDVGGQLVTGLPGTTAQGISSNTPKFGTVCYNELAPNAFSGCADVVSGAASTTAATVIPGGPGTQNFVPNNVTGNRLTGARASYYEVTLNKAGTTTLSQAATIDRLNISGNAGLTVSSSGNLTVLGDYTQTGGALSLSGRLKTGEAFIGAGQISGSGTFDPTFLTVLQAAVLPGGLGTFGTLTVQGDVILSSGSLTQFDVNRDSADALRITGDAQNAGAISLGGIAFFSMPRGPAPRAGQTYVVVNADGGVSGSFNTVIGRQGVLQPRLVYGANTVTLTLHAGSLRANTTGNNATANAFATALDGLRGSGYNNLFGLFGAIDVMDSAQLTNTLAGLAPRVAGVAQLEADEQRSLVLGMVGDRLSSIGTSDAKTGTLSVVGSPETLGLAVGQTSVSSSTASLRSFAGNVTPGSRSMGTLPENVSGFIAGGYDAGRPGTSAGGERSTWHIAMGLEMAAAPNLTIGTAFGYVNGRSNITGSQAETRTSQAVAYGSYRLSNKAYVAGMASVTHTDIGVQRGVTTGLDQFSLNGATSAMSYDLHLETGYNLGVAKGLTFTPRAALRYSSTSIDGYRERGGEVALLVDGIEDRRLEARLGARMSGSVNAGSGWAFAPELSVDQVQALSRDGSELQVRFAQSAGLAFTLPGLSRDRSWTEVKGGMKLTNGTFSIGAGVESSLGRSDYRDNRAVASFGIKF